MLKVLSIYGAVAAAAFLAFFAMSNGQSQPAPAAASTAAPSQAQRDFDASMAASKKASEKLTESLERSKKETCLKGEAQRLKYAEKDFKAGDAYGAFKSLDYCKDYLTDPRSAALYKRADAAVPDKAAAKAKAERAAKKKEGVTIGMTKQDVLDSKWGKPQRVNTTRTAYGTREQWVYGNGNYLYFEGAVLTSIQN